MPTVQQENDEVAGDRDDPTVSIQAEDQLGRGLEKEEVQIFQNI